MTATAALPANVVVMPRRLTRKVSTKKTVTKTATARTKTKRAAKVADHIHTSKLLRDLLEKNPDKSFSVEKIVASIGGTSAFGTSLMVFSLPEVLPIPIPGLSAIVVLPVGVISAQMATAIHAILPFLEKAEKYVKPRWDWAVHPVSQRFIGVFVFILALAIAMPVPGTNMPLAIAIFIIAMGLVEKDGRLITLGILLGLASFALLGGIILGALSLLGLV
jgi:hypothetical protein